LANLFLRGACLAAAENELVVAEGAAARGEVEQLEAAIAAKAEDCLGRRHLEGIAADPVDEIVPMAHAACPGLCPDTKIRAQVAAQDRRRHPPQLERHHDGDRVGGPQRRGDPVVEQLDRPPAFASAALVVVDRDEEKALGCDAGDNVL